MRHERKKKRDMEPSEREKEASEREEGREREKQRHERATRREPAIHTYLADTRLKYVCMYVFMCV